MAAAEYPEDDDALFVLASGIDQLVCARLRAGEPVTGLLDTLAGCAIRLLAEEEPWTLRSTSPSSPSSTASSPGCRPTRGPTAPWPRPAPTPRGG